MFGLQSLFNFRLLPVLACLTKISSNNSREEGTSATWSEVFVRIGEANDSFLYPFIQFKEARLNRAKQKERRKEIGRRRGSFSVVDRVLDPFLTPLINADRTTIVTVLLRDYPRDSSSLLIIRSSFEEFLNIWRSTIDWKNRNSLALGR